MSRKMLEMETKLIKLFEAIDEGERSEDVADVLSKQFAGVSYEKVYGRIWGLVSGGYLSFDRKTRVVKPTREGLALMDRLRMYAARRDIIKARAEGMERAKMYQKLGKGS